MEENPSIEKQFILRLTEIVEANLSDEHFGVPELCAEAGVSHTSLHRKLKRISNQSASQFIREIRLEHALELLQDPDVTVAEVAYKVGFGSSTYFSKCFHAYFGYPPVEASRQVETGSQQDRDPDSEDKPYLKEHPKINRKIIEKPLFISTVAVIVLAAILYFVINPFSNQQRDQDNSIAVLPFRNDSSDSINIYFINGLMETIVNNLASIEDLDVRSRTSSEKYRSSTKLIPEIAKELGVNYLVEASGQKYDDEVILTIQLIEAATDRHLMSKQFRRKSESVKELIDLQYDIALEVVSAIKAKITPEEKELMAKLPTENLAAYHLYLQAWAHIQVNQYYRTSYNDIGTHKEEMIVKQLFEEAIAMDSTYVDALNSLGGWYINNSGSMAGQKEQYLHSGMFFVNKALQYDEGNLAALRRKYNYYLKKGMYEEAEKMEPSLFRSARDHHYYRGRMYNYHTMRDYPNAIQSFYYYLEKKPVDILTPFGILRRMATEFRYSGFPELAKEIAAEMLQRNNDSIDYFRSIVVTEIYSGNYRSALEYGLNAYRVDSTIRENASYLSIIYLHLGDYSNALVYLNREKSLESKLANPVGPNLLDGYVYLMNGMNEKADFEFQGEIDRKLHQIEINDPAAQNYDSHYYIALTYFAMGNFEKGMEYLSMLKNRETIDFGIINDLKYFPVFDSARDRPEFNELLQDLEERYQLLHNRVRKILINEGVIDS